MEKIVSPGVVPYIRGGMKILLSPNLQALIQIT